LGVVIAVLKGLGLIDENGVPTQRYYDFLDQTQSGRVLADATREAYEDLFAVNKKAQDMSVDDVKNKLRTLTQGQKSDKVLSLMANTFKAVAALADWDAPPAESKKEEPKVDPEIPLRIPNPPGKEELSHTDINERLQLHYNIQIHLPESRDPAVFDAIFQALMRHLT